MSEHVVIVGAGVSGLAAAWRLASRGVNVTVLEAQALAGGLARTERVDGYGLDVGPHSFFSEDPSIRHAVLDLFDYALDPMPRTVKLHFNNRYLDYPLTPHTILCQMGLTQGVRIALSYLVEKARPAPSPTLGTEAETVEDWAQANFGRHLYENFFKPYTEQFWMIPCTQLSSRSIPTHTQMSFLRTLLGLVRGRGARQGSSLIEREALPTYYPRTGFGEIPERMAQRIGALGGRVCLRCEVTKIQPCSCGRVRVVYSDHGTPQEQEADYVLSTMPLPSLILQLGPAVPPKVQVAARQLEYRPLIILGLVTERKNLLRASYIYLLDRPYNRIAELNKFSLSASPPGDNVLMAEIPSRPPAAAGTAGEDDLVRRCLDSLEKDGILAAREVKRSLVVTERYAYPIYKCDYRRYLAPVLAYVAGQDSVGTLGRCGEFEYMDIDRCIRKAWTCADQLWHKLVDRRQAVSMKPDVQDRNRKTMGVRR